MNRVDTYRLLDLEHYLHAAIRATGWNFESRKRNNAIPQNATLTVSVTYSKDLSSIRIRPVGYFNGLIMYDSVMYHIRWTNKKFTLSQSLDKIFLDSARYVIENDNSGNVIHNVTERFPHLKEVRSYRTIIKFSFAETK